MIISGLHYKLLSEVCGEGEYPFIPLRRLAEAGRASNGARRTPPAAGRTVGRALGGREIHLAHLLLLTYGPYDVRVRNVYTYVRSTSS